MTELRTYPTSPVCGVPRTKNSKITCELPKGHLGDFNLDIGLSYTGHTGRGTTGRWYRWTAVSDEVYLVHGEEWYADLPVHLSMGVNENGDGPVDEADSTYYETVCWCGDYGCRKYTA